MSKQWDRLLGEVRALREQRKAADTELEAEVGQLRRIVANLRELVESRNKSWNTRYVLQTEDVVKILEGGGYDDPAIPSAT